MTNATTKQITSLQITAKEWFDRINGNSYFSARITVNGNEDIVIPFTYGYGDAWQWAAKTALDKAGYETKYNPERHCQENRIPYAGNIEKGCKKRDVIAFGKL
jgi:hypothetical protein